MFIGGKKSSSGIETDRVQPERREVGTPARGDQKALRAQRSARAKVKLEGISSMGDTFYLGIGYDGDILALEYVFEQSTCLGLFEGQQSGSRFNDGHLDPEASKGLAHLDGDRAAADDYEGVRQLFHFDRFPVRPEGNVGKAGNRGRPASCSGRQDDATPGPEATVADSDLAEPLEMTVTTHKVAAPRLEAIDRDLIVPIVGGLITDASSHDLPVWGNCARSR